MTTKQKQINYTSRMLNKIEKISKEVLDEFYIITNKSNTALISHDINSKKKEDRDV